MHGAEADDDFTEEEEEEESSDYQNSDVEDDDDDDVDYILRFWEDQLSPTPRSVDEFIGKLTRWHSV